MDASVLESVVGVVVGSLVGFVVGSVVGFVVIVLGFSVWPVVPVSSVGLVQPVSIPINVMTAILRQISFFIEILLKSCYNVSLSKEDGFQTKISTDWRKFLFF